MRAQDEEDEELVEKAKANRAKRLAEQRATTRTFIQVCARRRALSLSSSRR